MPRRRLVALLAAPVAVGLWAAAAPAAPPSGARGLTAPRYADGPTGRLVLGGRWLFRADPGDRGRALGFATRASTAGWTPVSVPNAWNARDQSTASMRGGVGWYRRDFRLPARRPAPSWLLRFNSVNYRAAVWLNGRPLGTHTGAFLPWELALRGVRRRGANRLVVRVDSRHGPSDLPPSTGGGWWNYGGLLREVELRRVDGVDLPDVRVLARLACRRCAASVAVRATVRSYARRPLRVVLRLRFGRARAALGTVALGPGGRSTVAGRVRIARPRLWSPADPHLYRTAVAARASAQGRPAGGAAWTLHSGMRALSVGRGGRLLLNFRPVHLRGVGLHEDDPLAGAAIGDAQRRRSMAWIERLGATLVRSHYPLHPYFEELADRVGVLLWSEIPVYQLDEASLARPAVRRAAYAMLRANLLANGNHPAVAIWSLGNELPPQAGPGQAEYLRGGAALARRLDPTRLVGYAVAGSGPVGCQAAYAPLDAIGINDYFGWYTGLAGAIADRDELSAYMDAVRACYPRQAVAVTELGAEANRAGPVEEKGTYAFQQDFARYQLGVLGAKPWLAAVDWWALQEFRVRPYWAGGNPEPSPPLHTKGLISFAGAPKPAFYDVRALYRATPQYGSWTPARRRTR